MLRKKNRSSITLLTLINFDRQLLYYFQSLQITQNIVIRLPHWKVVEKVREVGMCSLFHNLAIYQD